MLLPKLARARRYWSNCWAPALNWQIDGRLEYRLRAGRVHFGGVGRALRGARVGKEAGSTEVFAALPFVLIAALQKGRSP